MIAEGELVVRQLIRSRLRVHSVLLTPTRLETVRDALGELSAEVPVLLVEQELMNRVVGFNIHRGILAAGHRPAAANLDDLLARASSLIIAEDMANHDNTGGLFRAAAALGGPSPAVLFSPGSCDPFYRKSIRVSVGHVLRIPFATLEPWPTALDAVRRAGFTIMALTPGSGAVDLDQVVLPARPALLLGAEGPGLTAGALAMADLRVRIRMNADVDSLNVVMAAGIAMHRLTNR